MPELLTNADLALIALIVLAMLVGWSRVYVEERHRDQSRRARQTATAARYKTEEADR